MTRLHVSFPGWLCVCVSAMWPTFSLLLFYCSHPDCSFLGLADCMLHPKISLKWWWLQYVLWEKRREGLCLKASTADTHARSRVFLVSRLPEETVFFLFLPLDWLNPSLFCWEMVLTWSRDAASAPEGKKKGKKIRAKVWTFFWTFVRWMSNLYWHRKKYFRD